MLPVLIGGMWSFTDVLGETGTQVEERTLRLIASMAANSLDITTVKTLRGDMGDSGSQAFAALRAELKKIQRAAPNARFARLMGERGSDVVFLADAEDENSPEYSPPGQVYSGAPAALLRVFSDGGPLVEKPYRDKRGEWASGLAALKDGTTGRVVAVLGIDVPADDWRRQIGRYRLYGAGIVGFLLALFGILLFFQPEDRPPESPSF